MGFAIFHVFVSPGLQAQHLTQTPREPTFGVHVLHLPVSLFFLQPLIMVLVSASDVMEMVLDGGGEAYQSGMSSIGNLSFLCFFSYLINFKKYTHSKTKLIIKETNCQSL